MENITMDEVERKLNDKEMEKIFKRICTYFNKNESLIKKFKKKQDKRMKFFKKSVEVLI